jgi:hypothetical protein
VPTAGKCIQRFELDAESSACLPISDVLRFSQQCGVLCRVDGRQLFCAVLLEQFSHLCRESRTGFVGEDCANLFKGDCYFTE